MKTKTRNSIILLCSVVLLIIVFVIAIIVGRFQIKLGEFFRAVFTKDSEYDMQRSIIVNLRLPRTIIALLTGIALSLSGLLYQELFQNKLVSPDLLGVSSGAGVGAALAIVLGFSSITVSLFAFVFGVVSVLLTLLVARIFRNSNSTILLLSGIIVGGLMSALLSLIKYFAPVENTLATITYWLMGSFENSTMGKVYILLPIVVICATVLIVFRWRLNLIALGKEECQTKGLNYNAYRIVLIAIATLLTASTVAFSGTISWIGLVVPHMVRLVVGRNTKNSIPFCITFGGTFMMIVDVLSRTFTSSEIPVSAVTGLFGTIIFVAILAKRRGTIVDD